MLSPRSGSDPHRHHVVKPGDTLAAIAHRHGMDWHRIARANGITDPHALRIGTVLQIPAHGIHVDRHPSHAGPAAHPHRAAPAAPRPAPPAPNLPAPQGGDVARPAQGGGRLGDLSMQFETGYRPGQEARAAAVVSGGQNDPGGVSYGAYQLTSTVKGSQQVQAFLRAEGLRWAPRFAGLRPTVAGGPFGAAWRAVAAEQPAIFFTAQHEYIERTHYSPVVNHVRTVTQLDVNQRSRPVQNAVWSMSVQHGKAAMLVVRGITRAGPQGTASDADYDRALIEALYDVRSDYVDAIGQPGLKARYRDERRAALAALGTR